MSEHDEPKTALTGLLTEHMLILAPAPAITRCLCGADAGERMSLRAARWWFAAHLADVLLAEGYTTTPAPEAVETVEWGVLHPDGFVSGPAPARWIAEATVAAMPVRKVVTRTRTSYADRVTEWAPVDRAADEHEEGEQ